MTPETGTYDKLEEVKSTQEESWDILSSSREEDEFLLELITDYSGLDIEELPNDFVKTLNELNEDARDELLLILLQ